MHKTPHQAQLSTPRCAQARTVAVSWPLARPCSSQGRPCRRPQRPCRSLMPRAPRAPSCACSSAALRARLARPAPAAPAARPSTCSAPAPAGPAPELAQRPARPAPTVPCCSAQWPYRGRAPRAHLALSWPRSRYRLPSCLALSHNTVYVLRYNAHSLQATSLAIQTCLLQYNFGLHPTIQFFLFLTIRFGQ